MLVCLCVHIAHGFDILTTSISPPTTPVMQGETVTIKVRNLLMDLFKSVTKARNISAKI